MSKPWERQPRIPELLIWIVIICIIGYLLFPNLFRDISSSLTPTTATPYLSSVNPSSTNDLNTLNSTNSSSQLFPSVNNTTSSGNGDNVLASGYWILFVSNGASQQLSISTQDYSFVQGLIQSDNKGSAAVKIFLIDNGQIHQYTVSNEIYAILSNMAIIAARASNPSSITNSTPPITTSPTTILPATATSETLTVSNPSTTGFTVAVNPALNGLTISNFKLVHSLGNPVTLTSATTSDYGATYVLSAALSAGQSYTLTATSQGYTFGTAPNIVVP